MPGTGGAGAGAAGAGAAGGFLFNGDGDFVLMPQARFFMGRNMGIRILNA